MHRRSINFDRNGFYSDLVHVTELRALKINQRYEVSSFLLLGPILWGRPLGPKSRRRQGPIKREDGPVRRPSATFQVIHGCKSELSKAMNDPESLEPFEDLLHLQEDE